VKACRKYHCRVPPLAQVAPAGHCDVFHVEFNTNTTTTKPCLCISLSLWVARVLECGCACRGALHILVQSQQHEQGNRLRESTAYQSLGTACQVSAPRVKSRHRVSSLGTACQVSAPRVKPRHRMSSLGTGGARCFAKVCSMCPVDIRMLAFWNFIGKRDHALQTEKEDGTESWDSNPVYHHRPRRPWHVLPVPDLYIV